MVASTTFRLLLLAGCLLKASPFASIPWWSQPIIIDSTAPLDGWRPASVKTRRYLGVPRKPVNVQCHWAQSCSGYSKENVFFFLELDSGHLAQESSFMCLASANCQTWTFIVSRVHSTVLSFMCCCTSCRGLPTGNTTSSLLIEALVPRHKGETNYCPPPGLLSKYLAL